MASEEARFCLRCSARLVPAVDKNDSNQEKLRPSCPECGWIFYNNPVPVVAAIVQRGGQVVLLRNRGWPQDWFGLCSGFLESREEPALGVQREVLEELGLTATSCDFVGVFPFPRLNQLILVYHVNVEDSEPIRIDPVEIAEYKLVEIGKLEPWAGPTGQFFF